MLGIAEAAIAAEERQATLFMLAIGLHFRYTQGNRPAAASV